MKKRLPVTDKFFLVFCFSGCNLQLQADCEIVKYQWEMESVSNLEGDIIVSNLKQSDLAGSQCDLVLQFNKDNTFLLSDKTNNAVWNGTYSLERANTSHPCTSHKLSMVFENEESAFIGVYGTRLYNNSEIPSILFQTDDYILSFLAYEKIP